MDNRRVDLVGPTLLIGIGAILLLNNMGYLDWTVWDVLRLWPILLVSAGLQVLFGRRSVWGSIASAVVVIALIAGGIWLGSVEGVGPTRGQIEEISYGLGDAEAATIWLEPAIAKVAVGALVDSADLVEGTVKLSRNETLQRSEQQGDPAEVILSTQGNKPFTTIGLSPQSNWQLDVNSMVDLELVVDVGIGETTLDLSDLALDEARVDFGIGSVQATLPEASSASLRVDGGIGSVVIEVPAGVGARITMDAGLVGRRAPAGYRRDGDTYVSPNYSSADTQVEVVVSLGIGSISVQQLAGE